MPMKDAVLGLVAERRGYGYDLINRFNERFGEAWQLNPSTIYASLDSLAKNGYVREIVRPDPRTSRQSSPVIYEATAAGIEHLETWLTAPSSQVEAVRSEILLKVGLGRREYALGLIRVLDEQIDACANALARHLADAELSDGTVDWKTAARIFLNAAVIARLQADLGWLRMVRTAAEYLRTGDDVPLDELAGFQRGPLGGG